MGMESKDAFGPDKDQWALYHTQSTEAFIPHIESFKSYVENNDQSQTLIVLCFYFHPWKFWEMPEGVIHFGEGRILPDPFLVKGCGEYCLNQVELLIDWLKYSNAVFLTAGQCARKWQGILAEQEN